MWRLLALLALSAMPAQGFLSSPLALPPFGGNTAVSSLRTCARCSSLRARRVSSFPCMASPADSQAVAPQEAERGGFLRDFRKPLSQYRQSQFSGYLKAFREDPAGLLLAFSEDLESKGQSAISLDFGLLYRPRYLFLHNASDVEYVLKDRSKNFIKSRIRRETFGLVLGGGLFFAIGEKHAKTRRVMQPAFEMSALDKFLGIMQEEARALADEWEKEVLASVAVGERCVVEPEESIQKVTLDIVMRSMITRKVADEAKWMKNMIETCFRYAVRLSRSPMRKLRLAAGRLGLSSSYREFKARLTELDEYVLGLVAERKAAEAAGGRAGLGDDLLQMLMTARDSATGEGFTDTEIRDELVTMLLAGHDTTAVTMSWATLYLGMHPHLAADIAREAEEVLGDGSRPLTMASMRQLRSTLRFARELLRIRPPVWEMQREVVRDEVLPSGAKVEAGRIVLISPYVQHHKSAHWENPQEFNPDRFLADDGSDATPSMPDGTPLIIPFGLGSRTCIGAKFAEWELLVLIATLCQRFEFKTAMDREPSLLPLAILKPAQTISIELSFRSLYKSA